MKKTQLKFRKIDFNKSRIKIAHYNNSTIINAYIILAQL